MRIELNKLITCFSICSISNLCSVICSDKYTFFNLRRIALVSIILISVPVSAFNINVSTNITSSIANTSVLRSTSNRYAVISTNRVWNISLMRWVETLDIKIERLTGLKMSFDSRLIRIVVMDKQSGKSDVTWSQGYGQGRFIQHLNIYDYLLSDVAQSEIAICGLFLNGYVVDRQQAGRQQVISVKDDSIERSRLGKVPAWLALGVAKNLYPTYRAANSTELLSLYDKGELPSVVKLLQQFNDSEMDDKLNGSICGMFVLWLSKTPEHAGMFDKLFEIFAENKQLTAAELSSIINSCDSVNTMEKMWRDWVLRQKRMVYEFGVITPSIVEKLKGLLVITPEECSKVNGPATDINLPFSELISRRKESWVSACARQKNITLKLAFVGRGADMNKVVDLYCEFLDALEQRKSKRYLIKLLGKADSAMVLFSEKYGGVSDYSEVGEGVTIAK